MNRPLHEGASGIIYQSVPGQCGASPKCFGNDEQTVMSASLAGPRMTRMQMGFVLQLQLQGSERCQGGAQIVQSRRAHAGRTFLKGLTITAV